MDLKFLWYRIMAYIRRRNLVQHLANKLNFECSIFILTWTHTIIFVVGPVVFQSFIFVKAKKSKIKLPQNKPFTVVSVICNAALSQLSFIYIRGKNADRQRDGRTAFQLYIIDSQSYEVRL